MAENWNDGDILTLEELSKYLKVHPSTIYRLLKKHQLPAFKVGRDWRFNRESIDKWRFGQEKQENPPLPPIVIPSIFK